MTKKLYITFALLGSLLITSCDSFLDIQPIGKVIPNTLSEYRALLTEAYSQPLFDRGVTEFRTDEVTIRDNEYDQNYYSEIEKWNDSNPIPGTREFAWSNYYSIIYYANAIIDNRDKITEGTQEDIDQLVGEAYLLRGYMHFLLVNLYGQPSSPSPWRGSRLLSQNSWQRLWLGSGRAAPICMPGCSCPWCCPFSVRRCSISMRSPWLSMCWMSPAVPPCFGFSL